jgi:hypothetical protein
MGVDVFAMFMERDTAMAPERLSTALPTISVSAAPQAAVTAPVTAQPVVRRGKPLGKVTEQTLPAWVRSSLSGDAFHDKVDEVARDQRISRANAYQRVKDARESALWSPGGLERPEGARMIPDGSTYLVDNAVLAWPSDKPDIHAIHNATSDTKGYRLDDFESTILGVSLRNVVLSTEKQAVTTGGLEAVHPRGIRKPGWGRKVWVILGGKTPDGGRACFQIMLHESGRILVADSESEWPCPDEAEERLLGHVWDGR